MKFEKTCIQNERHSQMLTLNFPMSNIMSFSLRVERRRKKSADFDKYLFFFSFHRKIQLRIAEVKRAISLSHCSFYEVRFFSFKKMVLN